MNVQNFPRWIRVFNPKTWGLPPDGHVQLVHKVEWDLIGLVGQRFPVRESYQGKVLEARAVTVLYGQHEIRIRQEGFDPIMDCYIAFKSPQEAHLPSAPERSTVIPAMTPVRFHNQATKIYNQATSWKDRFKMMPQVHFGALLVTKRITRTQDVIWCGSGAAMAFHVAEEAQRFGKFVGALSR
jgi:hypothetical protein